MRLGFIGNTEIRIHFAVVFVIAGAAICGMMEGLLYSFIALTLHESCHAITAHQLGYDVACIEFMPFGGVARLKQTTMAPAAEWMIAMAGPLCSLVIGAIAATTAYVLPDMLPQLKGFINANMTLAIFNLFPALPLDGGRILRAILTHILRPRIATLIGIWTGILLGAVMTGIGIYLLTYGLIQPTLMVMGGFLLLAALKELRTLPTLQLSAMMQRQTTLKRGECLRLRHVVLHDTATAGEALRQMSANQYNLILVVNNSLSALGELDEGTILQGIAKHGADISLSSLLKGN